MSLATIASAVASVATSAIPFTLSVISMAFLEIAGRLLQVVVIFSLFLSINEFILLISFINLINNIIE